MQVRPKILLRYGRINEPIRIPLVDLIVDAPQTILMQDTAAGATSLTVKNTTGFADSNQIFFLVGTPGSQGCTILGESAVSSISVLTLTDFTSFNYSASTTIRQISFDQVEISNAPTVNGTKTVLATIPLTPNQEATEYNDLASTSGSYYFARFYNSDSSDFSEYSDPAPYDGYTILSARSIIDTALNEINKNNSEMLTDEFAFQQLDNFQTEVLREQKRWMFMQSFDTIIGHTLTGTWKVAAPANLDDQFTNKTAWHFKIGKQENMIFVDKEKWDEITSYVAHDVLDEPIIASSYQIVLADSSDFDDQGQVSIGPDSFSYVSNDRSNGTLLLDESKLIGQVFSVDITTGTNQGSGYTAGNILTLNAGNADATIRVLTVDGGGAITSWEVVSPGTGYWENEGAEVDGIGGTGSGALIDLHILNLNLTDLPIAANTDVFQGAQFGEPMYWTIWQGFLYHYPITAATFSLRNYYLDFYKKQTRITKDSDEIVIPDQTAAIYYLQWKFLKKINSGKETQESKDQRDLYIVRREKIKQKDSIGRTFRLKPLKNTINENSPYGGDSKFDRLQGWWPPQG